MDIVPCLWNVKIRTHSKFKGILKYFDTVGKLLYKLERMMWIINI